jgi:hypothetical protein
MSTMTTAEIVTVRLEKTTMTNDLKSVILSEAKDLRHGNYKTLTCTSICLANRAGASVGRDEAPSE